jgi:hypothetical protein
VQVDALDEAAAAADRLVDGVARDARAVTPQTGGLPDAVPESLAGREAVAMRSVDATMLNRATTLDDIASVLCRIRSGAR